jgi:hypothetical protein
MSLVKVQGNASGTGIFTIAAPATNTDRTLTLPDSSGTMATAESTLSQFNASGSAPVYACRAWVNFNGTGTVAIRASGNVSSITDNGTGDYTVNFTTAMPDANYSVNAVCSAAYSASNTMTNIASNSGLTEVAPTTSAIRFTNSGWNGTEYDATYVSVSIFR